MMLVRNATDEHAQHVADKELLQPNLNILGQCSRSLNDNK